MKIAERVTDKYKIAPNEAGRGANMQPLRKRATQKISFLFGRRSAAKARRMGLSPPDARHGYFDATIAARTPHKGPPDVQETPDNEILC